MKFKQLTIHNIASIADATIDFDQKPLEGESLFLICGETGSGKTTILDAICLALYKTTPRIKQTKSEKYVDESLQVIKNGENQGIQVSDPRQYLRRGANEGYVELSFVGNANENCVARIEFGIVGRSNNLKPVAWLLKVDNQYFTKDSEINETIKKVVGFDFEQFCRTTMLAQGEFTRFLKSGEKEKSDILEKLTGTEIYSEIGKRIFEVTKEKENIKRETGIALETISLLDDEALNGLREQRAQAETESKATEVEKNRLESKKQWLEKENELVALQQKAIMDFADWEAKNHENQVVEDRKTVVQWHRTEKERQAIVTLRKLKQEETLLQAKNQRLEENYKRLIAGELFRKNEIEAKQKEMEKLSDQLDAERQYDKMYADSQSIITKLQQHFEDTAKARHYEAKAKEEEVKLPELERDLQQRQAEQKKAEDALNAKAGIIKTKQEELNQLNPNQLNRDFLRMSEELRQVEEAENKLKSQVQAAKDLNETKTRIAAMERTIQEKATELESLNPQIIVAHEVFEAAKNLYEKIKASVGDYAKALRHELHEGDVCPVCGNKITVLERDEVLEQALKPHLEDFKNKENQLNELIDRKKLLDAEVKTQKENLENAKTDERKKAEVLKTAQAEVERVCQNLNINLDFNNLEQQLTDIIADKTAGFEALKQNLENAQAKQQEINGLNKEKEELLAAEKKAREAVSEAEKDILDLKSNVKNFNNLALQKRAESAQGLKEVSDKISYPDGLADLKQTMTRLKADAERFAQWQKQKDLLEAQIENAKTAQGISRRTCEQVKGLFPDWEISREARQVDDLDNAWSDLLAEATQLHGNLENNRCQMIENKNVIDSFLASESSFDLLRLTALSSLSHSEIADKESSLNELQKNLQTANGALAQAKQNLESHRLSKPEMEEGYTLESLGIQIDAKKESLTELARQMGEVDSQIKANDANREAYNEKKRLYEHAEQEWLKWESLCKLFGDKEGKTFRVIAQSYVLRELLSHANAFLQNFSDRYELVCQNNLTILVRDLYFGGVARPVDLVSGGESFIVSLALALGLSSLNRNSLSADILFIDEGFGTLDPTVLDVVMNTLGRLQTLGDRRVGVISHVEALRERIPVKILVEKKDNTTSYIRIE